MRRSLRSWIWRVPLEQEVDDELRFHFDMLVREQMAQGIDATTAQDVARRRLGDPHELRHTCLASGRKRDRHMRVTQWLEELDQDVRFALRQLKSAPTFTVVAALTLALGIGANSAIFALVDAVLLRQLPLPNADRLVAVFERTDETARGRVAPPNMIDWNARSRSFEQIAAYSPSVGGMVMAGADGQSETVSRQWVTAGFFDVAGVRARFGRTFLAQDDADRANLVVLSESYWRTRFGSDPRVVGRVLTLDGLPFTVVGIVSGDFQLFGRTSLWGLMPLDRRPALRSAHFLQGVGRLRPGVTRQAANADLDAIADSLAAEFPATNAGRRTNVEPLRDALVGADLRLTSTLFLSVVGFVLMMCCANVASLLLARASSRTREIAIRAALGAGRRRVVRQMLTESLVLSTIGGALGLGLGALILRAAPSVVPAGLLPPAVTLQFDLRIVLFCVLMSVFVGVLFGLAPAWQMSGTTSAQALTASSRSITGHGSRLRAILVAGEVAAAVLLMVGAGLLLRTLLALDRVDRGYGASQVLTMMVDPLGSQFPNLPSLLGFFGEVDREVSALPGVQTVGWTSTLPMGRSEAEDYEFEIVGDPAPRESKRPMASYQTASRGYFDALDIPIVQGRGFTDFDTKDAPAICIVNEAFVRGHLSGRAPLGVKVAFKASPEAPAQIREIVGVARQVKGRVDERQDAVQVYVPVTQYSTDDIFFVVRPTSGRADALAAAVRAAIGRVDRQSLVSVREVMTIENVEWAATERHRFRALTVVVFAALALVLAIVGVFGILAYSVQQRERDFAVRRALGAHTRDVMTLVGGSAVRVVAAGVGVGLLLAAAVSRWLESVLFGVTPLDATTFGVAVLAIGITAAAASVAPAWRASRVDPATALKAQ